MIDQAYRERLREALTEIEASSHVTPLSRPGGGPLAAQVVFEAARLVASDDTLIVEKVNVSEITLADLSKHVRQHGDGPVYADVVTLDELLIVVADAVQPGRLVVETPCEHGQHEGHWKTLANATQDWCSPRVSRRIIPTGDTE